MTTPSQNGPGGAGPDERLPRAEHIIGALDKGVAVLAPDRTVRWANDAFRKWCPGDPVGKEFFEALDTPPDARPSDDAFQAALAGSPATLRVRQANNLQLDVTLSPVREGDRVIELVALCEDVTTAAVRQEKLNALYKAGQDLDSLDADQLAEMNVACRVELLKQNVRRYVHDLLRYNVVEVRMLDPHTGRLIPLMEEGMTKEAAERELYARTEGNGVTGYVAATGRPYLCPDTTKDPHFIEGSVGARSSMTVPIVHQDQVIGTFNVESPEPNAFGPEDLQFTELFARELARSLHTLNLLNAQEQCAALGVIDLVNKEIALPADDLLAVASGLIDQLADKPDAVDLLRRVLTDARKIKLAVRKIGGDVGRPAGPPADAKLDGMRVLVIDADERVRRAAHSILERKGCVVETAAGATEGIAMAKAGTYDAVLVSVKHKDMGGTAAYRALVQAVPLGRVILTQGFEYDGGHTVVNARQDGYWLPVLFKPFQEPVLFKALTSPAPRPEPAGALDCPSMPLAQILLFLLAWVGHGYLLMLALNVAYSQPFHRKLLKLMRWTWALLLVAGPPMFGSWVGFDLVGLSRTAVETGADFAAAAYIWACWLAGVAFLAVTTRRLLRRRPAVVLDERTETIDIAEELCHRPVGDGKYRHIAAIPVNDLFRVDFTSLTLAVPGLPPAWDGLTILHLSDLHFYGTPGQEYYHAVIRHCVAGGTPDLLVLSGDIIDGEEYLDWIGPILSPLKWNVAAVAILGNHDWWQDFDGVRKRLAALGMHVVSNRWHTIDVRGEPVVAIGHEGPWFRPPPDLAGCPEGFRLLVSHTPDNMQWARRNDCRLMLSGHNHGGQIRLPLIGSMFVPSLYSRRYDMGTFHEPPTVLHVNRGLAGKEAIRFRCHPQVTRITLRAR